MDYKWLRVKVPKNLRVNFAVPKGLGDTPIALITRPSNVGQPTGVTKTGDKQYLVTFDPSSVGETVDIKLSSEFSLKAFLRSVFTLSFWLGMLPGRDFFRTFTLRTFLFRSFVFSMILFVALVALELSGISVHKPFSRWLNTMEMAERSGDTIKSIFNEPDPFFKSSEAADFYARVGKELNEVYLMTVVQDDHGKYRMLVRKDFIGADDLDSAGNVCEKELNAVIPTMSDYQLFMGNNSLRSDMSFAFAEWTRDSKGMMSDDYRLFVQPDHVNTWQVNITEIKTSSGKALTELADTYGIKRADLNDDDLRKKIVETLNKELRLPGATDIIYDEGTPGFYLDSDLKANFRCVRRIE